MRENGVSDRAQPLWTVCIVSWTPGTGYEYLFSYLLKSEIFRKVRTYTVRSIVHTGYMTVFELARTAKSEE